MHTTVGLKDLLIHCVIGVHSGERTAEQAILVDVSLSGDWLEPTHTDRIAETVDYEAVASLLTELACSGRYQLLESFGSEATTELLGRFEQVTAIDLLIRKPGAVPAAGHAFVRIRRERGR